jgi:hypothetical protein
MYYEEETVESELQCKLCNQMFEDPRMLPCGNICCFKCIIGRFDETNSYKCKCCENIHEKKEDNEYPISILANSLLEKAKNKISPEFIQLNFKEQLEKFKTTIDGLDEKQQNYKSNLSEYCELVRSQIILRTESLIYKLNKHCDEMCKKVDQYEGDKKNEWDNENKEYRTSLTKLINDNRTVQNEMKELYKNQIVETIQIEKAIELMKHNSINIENEYNELSKMVCNLKYLQNDQEIDIDSIVGGIIKVEKCEKLNLVDQEANKSIFDASFTLNDKSLLVFYYHDDHYHCFSSAFDFYDHYPVFKHSTNEFWEKVDLFYLFNDYVIIQSSNRVVIYKYHSDSNKFENHGGRFIRNCFRCKTMCADNDNIFIMNLQHEIVCLDWNLNEVKTIQQNNDKNLSIYFDYYEQIDIRNKKFYSRKYAEIDIVDENDGTLIKTIDVKCYKFIIDDNKGHLVAFCSDSINRYQLESGVLVSKIDLNGSIPNEYKFHDYKDDKYLLSSKNKKDLYSIKI